MIVDQASERALDHVLHELRLRDTCYCRTELSAPWALDMAACSNIVFHFVAAGECWLDAADEPRHLPAGSLIVFPRGTHHRLLGEPEVPAEAILALPIAGQTEPATYISHGGGGRPALVLCGGAAFDPPEQPLVAHLPEMLAIGDDDDWVGATLRRTGREAAERRPGGETVISRLFDVLVIHAVREWLATSPDAHRGWLGALRDPHIGRALLHIHERPADPFTVASLAAAAHMSRAAFAERFTALVGKPPMAYVTERRMQLATELMRTHGLQSTEVAERVGYGSVAAFSRAYKRTMGTTPSAARARAPGLA